METTPIAQDSLTDVPPPKKYVRTFEGDIEVAKKGGTADLPPREGPIPLKTYAGDFSQRMKETHASTTTVLAAEQDAVRSVPQDASEKLSRGNVLYVIAGIILLILGGSGASIAYMRYLKNTGPIILAPAISAPIFIDEKEEIGGANQEAILKAIIQSVTRSLAPHTVRLLYIDSTTTDTDNSVFSALQLPAPGILLRNIHVARSMAGIVSIEGEQNPFFILSVASYGDTFSGMLSWESTMPRDLNALFPEYPHSSVSAVSTSSPQTTATSSPTIRPTFHDEVISNHDARVYRDANNRSILVYGYWNRTTLIIARNPSAFIEIIGRLATAYTQR